jgi:alpha-D-xyloside xylohydrolase
MMHFSDSVRVAVRRVSAVVLFGLLAAVQAASGQVMGERVDVSQEFQKLEPVYFVGSQVTEFDPATGSGQLQWDRYRRGVSFSFDKVDRPLSRANSDEFPGTEYDRDPKLPFSLTFVSPRTVRLRCSASGAPLGDGESLMLAGKVPTDHSWKMEQIKEKTGEAVKYTSQYGSVKLIKNPWHVEFYDAAGKLLTRTRTIGEPATYTEVTPFCFIRRASDMSRHTAAAFELSYDEKIFGCGESFTRLNKRGQKIILYLRDGMGVQNQRMYKPIPFFLSSNGYGMFVHTSTPVTLDIGHDFDQSNVIYTGDDVIDIFVFLGEPKDVLSEYTAITGRSPMPPLWSFGLWMSRITYKAEAEVRDVAAKLREHRVPCDVIHLDTGWFETDWQCNYEFAPSRFDDPAKMMSDLAKEGIHICLWQLPYFTTKNSLYDTIVKNGYMVRNEGGHLPYLDAILDFSNPETVKWYQGKLAALLKLGVGAIKVDFGEDSPLRGLYASGRSGWYEHNLYPLRYNKAVADVTKEVTGENIIWARSAWAGSQRYPLHWGGDAENTNSAMAATLRGGLSLGLCGFTYWSHDAGGFVERAPRDLYRRWLPFAALTSHTRCHGAPPREPWGYDDAFVDDFRRTIELKYKLMPYIYAQAKVSSEYGHPMLRTLFFEFPDDPTSWLIEDQYMFGTDLMVAPLFSKANSRRIYLPPGKWIDYQSGQVYPGTAWHEITAGEVPIIVLVKDGAVIPHIGVARSTADMDWSQIELRVFSTDGSAVSGLFAPPAGDVQTLRLQPAGGTFSLVNDPLEGKVQWRITRAETR